MGYRDLYAYFDRLASEGKLHRIREEVGKDWDLSAVARVAFQSAREPRRPGLLFEKVWGYDIPVAVGIRGASRSVYALALDTEVERIPDVWAEARWHSVPPRQVADGPCQEVVLDATRNHRFPPQSGPPAEDLERVRARWDEYGFRSPVGDGDCR